MARGTTSPSMRTPRSAALRTRRSATGSPPTSRDSSSSMSAPIAPSTSRMPARVGLSPTPVSSRSASGCSVAATIHAAAVLMSPGTRTSTASRSPAGGVSVTAVPSVAMPAPITPSMRSVWSRDRDGSTTVVGPSAARPASSSADLTCADATGVSMRCPPASGPPSITSGGSVPSARAVMRAPRARSGETMRPIGRRRNDPSPLRTDRNGNPASIPLSSRIVVPELPQSRTSAASARPARPRPCTTSRPPPSSSMSTPRARIASRVERVSAASRKPSMTASPAAMALNSSARWVIDLSPGTSTVPRRRAGGETVMRSETA